MTPVPERMRCHQASLVFSSYLTSLGERRMLDTRSGDTFDYAAPGLADFGDLLTYPTDTVRTFQAVAAETRDITGPAGRAIFLNGDHSCTFPTFSGFRAARLAHAGGRVGFINMARNSRSYGQVQSSSA
jgi:arginase family enzyme